MEQMNFSARAHDRILKVARTLADLAGKQDITGNEILEASRSVRWIGGCSNEAGIIIAASVRRLRESR